MTDDEDNTPHDCDVEEEARKVIEESLEMGDYCPVMGVEEDCAICGEPAIRREPETDEWLCDKHSKDRFRERHG